MDNSAHHNYYHIDVKPVSGALGAEINGVDISDPLDAEAVSYTHLTLPTKRIV